MECLDRIVAALVYPVLWWVFLNGWDELFLDFCFLYFKLTGRTRNSISLEQASQLPERRVALFVPLWKESPVIEEMVDHNSAAIDYSNYDIFLGVYPNDPRTMEKALLLEERYANVHWCLCPHDGPTNKADCLNWIYQRMLLEEQARGIRYELVVQHDAEDIVHPKALRLINSLAGEFDMVQIPVFPLPTAAREFTHGTYCDEFAEFQVKDLLTRQFLGGFVPSTGVGTAFRREALDEMAREYRNQIFNVATVTEDYEIGLRFKLHNKRQRFVWERLPARNGNGNGRKNGNGNGRKRSNGVKKNGNGGLRNGNAKNGRMEYVATREYFPRTFRQAVRQKSRWVMGVALQAWEQVGWRPSQLYWLWRDRKGLAGNTVTILCNAIFFYCLAQWAGGRLFHSGWELARIFPPHTAAWGLLLFNTVFLAERLAFRMYSVNRVYGWRQSLWAVPRTLWGNLINFCSTLAALFMYFRVRMLRHEVEWSKTAHAFPDRDQLMAFKRRLGELLLELRQVSASALEKALAEQENDGERLGEILVRRGVLAESDVLEALGRQQGLEVAEVRGETIAVQVLRTITARMAEQYEVIPVAFRNHRTLVVAGPEVLAQEAQDELRLATGYDVQLVLTTRANWRRVLDAVYTPTFRLADALVRLGRLPEECIQAVQATLLAELLRMEDADSLAALFQVAGLEFRRLSQSDLKLDAQEVLPQDLQRALRVVPVEFHGDAVVVAVAAALAEADRARLETACHSRVRLIYTPLCDLEALLK